MSTNDAKREPVAWLAEERTLFDDRYRERLFSEEPPKGDPRYRKIRPLYADPPPDTDLEARLAEALKALDDIETHARLVPVHTSQVTAGQLMSSKLTMIRDIASKAARRVREVHGGER